MTTISASAGSAELWLISDFPIDDDQLHQIRLLFGENTTDADLTFRSDRKVCGWPLCVSYPYGEVTQLSFHVFLCACFLMQRRGVVDRIHQLGCNLELSLHVPGITEYFSLAAGTMKQLADLDVQFSLMPTTART